MDVIKIPLTRTQKRNLAQLATYLEGLPADYQHFDMESYFDHTGSCGLEDAGLTSEVITAAFDRGHIEDSAEAKRDTLYANDIARFLGNCGTTACAIGHGPAAGVALRKKEIQSARVKGVTVVTGIDFHAYMARFGVPDAWGSAWSWLFCADWQSTDNSHYGAAARIRFLLKHGGALRGEEYTAYPDQSDRAVKAYAPFRIDSQLDLA